MHVLIVEGDATALARRMLAFRAAGHAAIATATTEQALCLMRRTAFDLVLVDPFSRHDWNFAMLALARITAPTCQVMLLTSSPLFTAGELFQMTPQAISIVRAPIADDDLIILCEERLSPVRSPTREAQKNGGTREEGAPPLFAVRTETRRAVRSSMRGSSPEILR